jgi:hypothetical protein
MNLINKLPFVIEDIIRIFYKNVRQFPYIVLSAVVILKVNLEVNMTVESR